MSVLPIEEGSNMKLYHVTKVIDGDTFEVDPPISKDFDLQPLMRQIGNKTLFTKVRLANINTSAEIGTPLGDRAMLYLKGLLEGKRVILKPTEISYDRVVADVWRYPNQVFISAMMVYSGYAEWQSKSNR